MLGFGEERTIKAGRNTVGEEELTRKLAGDRGAAIGTSGFRQHPPADAQGHLIIHHPQTESNIVPAEVAEAAERFQFATDPDVVLSEILCRGKTEVAGDPLQLANTVTVIQCLSKFVQSQAVHEHHPVHELDFVFLARFDHFDHFCGITTNGLFCQDMFPRFGSADDPFLTESRWIGDVDGVNLGMSKKFFVTSHRDRL